MGGASSRSYLQYPHIAALLQGVRDLSLDPGVVEPEPEVNPAGESSSSESESVSVGSAETDIRWYAVWQVPNQPEGIFSVQRLHGFRQVVHVQLHVAN